MILFLQEHGWGRATPFACCKIQLKSKNRRISKTVSNASHTSKALGPEGNLAWITQHERDQTNTYRKFTEGESISSCKKSKSSNVKPYNCIPVMTAHPEGERMNGQQDSFQAFLGEESTLPIKEYEIKLSQEHTKPTVLKCPKIYLPGIIQSTPPSNFSFSTLNALFVLKPNGKGIVSLHLEPLSKNEKITEKTERGGSTSSELALHGHRIKKGKQKRNIGVTNKVATNVGSTNKIATKKIKNYVPPFCVSSKILHLAL